MKLLQLVLVPIALFQYTYASEIPSEFPWRTPFKFTVIEASSDGGTNLSKQNCEGHFIIDDNNFHIMSPTTKQSKYILRLSDIEAGDIEDEQFQAGLKITSKDLPSKTLFLYPETPILLELFKKSCKKLQCAMAKFMCIVQRGVAAAKKIHRPNNADDGDTLLTCKRRFPLQKLYQQLCEKPFYSVRTDSRGLLHFGTYVPIGFKKQILFSRMHYEAAVTYSNAKPPIPLEVWTGDKLSVEQGALAIEQQLFFNRMDPTQVDLFQILHTGATTRKIIRPGAHPTTRAVISTLIAWYHQSLYNAKQIVSQVERFGEISSNDSAYKIDIGENVNSSLGKLVNGIRNDGLVHMWSHVKPYLSNYDEATNTYGDARAFRDVRVDFVFTMGLELPDKEITKFDYGLHREQLLNYFITQYEAVYLCASRQPHQRVFVTMATGADADDRLKAIAFEALAMVHRTWSPMVQAKSIIYIHPSAVEHTKVTSLFGDSELSGGLKRLEAVRWKAFKGNNKIPTTTSAVDSKQSRQPKSEEYMPPLVKPAAASINDKHNLGLLNMAAN